MHVVTRNARCRNSSRRKERRIGVLHVGRHHRRARPSQHLYQSRRTRAQQAAQPILETARLPLPSTALKALQQRTSLLYHQPTPYRQHQQVVPMPVTLPHLPQWLRYRRARRCCASDKTSYCGSCGWSCPFSSRCTTRASSSTFGQRYDRRHVVYSYQFKLTRPF